jgi:protein-tyrosine phosphatase
MQEAGHFAAIFQPDSCVTLRCHPSRPALFSIAMIDIHCHILPDLDDGSESIEMSVEMGEMAIADGITHVIGTPHAHPKYPFIPELVMKRRDEVQAHFEGRLTIATGCDFHLSYENLQEIRHFPTRYTLNQKKYLLVEFADYSIPPSMDQTLHELHLSGIFPIITHPERNPLIRSKPERLYRWLRQGCYAQVTAGSLAGRFGKPAQEAAEEWLGLNAVHFLASDAHNVSSRPLRLKETYDHVAKTRGADVAQALLVDNPLAAFEGKPLPWVPELDEDIGLAPGGSSTRKRKRFWFF